MYPTIKKLIVLFILQLFFTSVQAEKTPIIAAASSTQFVLEKIKTLFIKETGLDIKISYGSSGNLSKQIIQGAPFELFISADASYVSMLKRQLTKGVEAIYAIGRIALFVPKDSPIKIDEQLNGLKIALKSKKIKRFAIANPEHAPYGRIAQEALKNSGIWKELKQHLVFAENIAQTVQYSSSSITQEGLISYSYALLPVMQDLGHYVLLPQSLDTPLNASMVLTKKASPTTTTFFKFLQNEKSQQIFNQYGFLKSQTLNHETHEQAGKMIVPLA